MIHVTDVRHAEDHKLAVRFSDGSSGVADMTEKLGHRVFAPLRDAELFAQAFVADGTVCWPGDIDIAPESLYALAHGLSKPSSVEDAIKNENAVALRSLRELLGVTQAELAAIADMSQGDVSRLESRSDYKLSTLRRVIEALGLELEVFAVGKGKRIRVA